MKVRKQHQRRQLRIFRAPSGQWAGRVTDGTSQVAGVAGCETPGDVQRLTGIPEQDVEIDPTGHDTPDR
ncbi:hypothetical protein [Paraburkholderia acidisoli]|uniref:DUF2188 domain-containing protein n=1 Tax=Paraburkholderia acidisoli TaxID=2571748 RepID=A0A7Z2JGL2_9BURK|nr:hypothetical protein [Paraburkholderia acidisoli]QGZ64732.1 hypothetical protein FAZ98_23165 [Paraburkholderia acidisoli]